jgi:hypothetical protein
MSTGDLTLLSLSEPGSQPNHLNRLGLQVTSDPSDPRVCGVVVTAAEEAGQLNSMVGGKSPRLLLVYGERVPYGLAEELRSQFSLPEWEVVRLFSFAGGERALIGGPPDGIWVSRLRRHLAQREVISLVCRVREVDETARQLPLYLAWKEQFYFQLGRRCDETGVRLQVVSRALGMDKRVGQGWLREEQQGSEWPIAGWLASECTSLVQKTNVERIALWGSEYFWKRVSLDWTSDREVRWFSPGHHTKPNKLPPRWQACDSWRESVADADLLVIGEADEKLSELPLSELVRRMRRACVIDACACFPLPEAEAYSLFYRTVGQNTNVWEWSGL